jgi:hypothetical protein
MAAKPTKMTADGSGTPTSVSEYGVFESIAALSWLIYAGMNASALVLVVGSSP